MNSRTLPVVSFLVYISVLGGCRTPSPLPMTVSCGGISSLHVGDDYSTVERAIGTPIDRPKGKRVTSKGREYDEMWHYTYANPPEMYEYRDNLDLEFYQHRLANVFASRALGRVAHNPGGGNPVVAYRLFTDPDGREGREYGPAFEEVFQCEPGFVRPPADADR